MAFELTFCELRSKEVINVCDGKRLGRIYDIVFTFNGKVVGLVAPGDRSFFRGIGGVDSIFIPWCCIRKIGDDVILVELPNPSR
ncbi:MAG: YlmC/YmxH family sporulation protein [Christensenellales bacterium]|jgi:YlmC/YmxH family sporulation protein